MKTVSIRRSCVVALAAALLGGSVRLGAAQQGLGSIAGHVADSATHRGLVGAQVVVVGTTRRAFSDAKGDYSLDQVSAGNVELRVRVIGYATDVKQVTVQAGQTAGADVALALSVVGLEAVVVTATGEQTIREQGNAVAKIDAAKVMSESPVTNAADQLTGRTPGLLVQPSGGTTGTGARVRIRGANSVTLSNEPVIVVDGIRVENGANSNSVGVGGQCPSRLN